MISAAATPTPTDLVAACSSKLEASGYRAIREGFPEWNTPFARLFEDEYNVVGIAVYSTCAELLRSWVDQQGSLVEAISSKVGLSEGKAWDGYLVLLTAGPAPYGETGVEDIRRDTTRVRKLVATGQELSSPSDVERLLGPLLPLSPEPGSARRGTALDRLPDLLAAEGVDSETTRLLVRAFLDQKPMMDALHSAGRR